MSIYLKGKAQPQMTIMNSGKQNIICFREWQEYRLKGGSPALKGKYGQRFL